MNDTLILLTFDNDSQISELNHVELDSGKLILSSGQTEGTMTSNEFTADENFNDYEIRGITNDDCRLIEVYVSNDGGEHYKQTGLSSFNNKNTITDTIGKRGRIKVTLKSDADNPTPELDSIELLVKRI